MNDYAYIVCSKHDYFDITLIMLESLCKECTCSLILYVYDFTKQDKERVLEIYKNPVKFIDIPETQWHNNRMGYKIEQLVEFPFEKDNRVLVLDSDMYIKSDIFKIFEDKEYDVVLTEREGEFSINGGVWGFIVNSRSMCFLHYFIKQIHCVTWQDLIEFRKEHKHTGTDWWIDQDFLCVVHDFTLPINCNVGYVSCEEYNYTPERYLIGEAVHSSKYKVLHFKSRLKQVWVQHHRGYIMGTIKQPLYIELGAGNRPRKKKKNGWLHHDIRKLPGIDIVTPCDKLSLLPGTVDVFYSSHLIEHIAWDLFLKVLKYWYSLLKPGGRCSALCPNAEYAMRKFLSYSAQNKLPDAMTFRIIWGTRDAGTEALPPYNEHHNGFTLNFLRMFWKSAGFEHIEVKHMERFGIPDRDLYVTGRKPS